MAEEDLCNNPQSRRLSALCATMGKKREMLYTNEILDCKDAGNMLLRTLKSCL